MVEMDNMIMDRMGTHDQISDVLGINLGISMPRAFSTERTEASAWTDVQTPQKRWVNSHASLRVTALENYFKTAPHLAR